MKIAMHLGWCLVSIAVSLLAEGQQATTNGSQPSASSSPASQQAGLQDQHAATPNSPSNNQNQQPGTTNDAGTSLETSGLGNVEQNNGPTQHIYDNSSAVDSNRPMPAPSMQQGRAMSPGGQQGANHSQARGNAQQRGQLGVWLIESAGPGVQIARVTSGSAADRAGLQAGDAILQVNGHGAMSPIEAARMIRAIPVGQTAMLTIWHEGGERQIQVTMEPAREAYHVGYRGDENPTASVSGDLAARISQLEQQVRSMQDELQHMKQMRQQMMQTQDTGTAPGSSARPSVNNETSPPPGFGSPEQKATPSEGSTSTPGNTGTSGSSNSSGNSGTSSSASGTSGSSSSTADSQDLFGSGPTTPSTGQSKPSSK